jgi:hypothetical protein
VLKIELRDQCILDECYITELHPQPNLLGVFIRRGIAKYLFTTSLPPTPLYLFIYLFFAEDNGLTL